MTTTAQQALQKIVTSCKEGHSWQPTIITGYYLCSHCPAIAACLGCVPKASGNPKRGYCRIHRDLRAHENVLEVLP